MNLTPHFTLEELTITQVRADNTPSPEIVERLKYTASNMEIVRHILGDVTIIPTSGYRSLAVNTAIGGSKTSAHMEGYAVDFICPKFGKPIDIVRKLAYSNINFDQLIQEGTWVHISFDPKMRGQIMTAHFDKDGKVSYVNGIEESTHG